MSRFYGMSIKITGHDEKKAHAIFKAIKKEWDFQDEFFHDITAQEDEPRFLSAYGEGYLCGGESEEEFTDRIALAVWKANGGYCHIQVDATYLEDLPCETHIRDDDDYYRMTERERI
jgi:hypothetical protein